MIACTPITATGTAQSGIHIITLPLTSTRLGDARCFGIITGNPNARSTSDARRIANITIAVENIASIRARAADDDADAHAWLQTTILDLRQQLNPALVHGVHACLGVAAEADGRLAITIACAGALGALLIQRRAGGAPRAIPIAAPQSKTDGFRFPHAVDGTIDPQDVIVIGSPALFDPHATDAVVHAFREHPTRDAIAALQPLASEHGFCGMVIAEESAREAPRSQSSMHALLTTAASTERFLTPSLGPVLRSYSASIRSAFASIARQRRSPRAARRSMRSPRPRILPFLLACIRMAFRTIVVGVRSIVAITIDGIRLFGIAIVRTARAIRLLYRRLRTREAERTSGACGAHGVSLTSQLAPTGASGGSRLSSPRPERRGAHVSARPDRSVGGLRSWYRSLPPLSQRLFLLTVTFAALFLISTGALVMRRTADMDVAAYNATIASIEELRSVAEARLLFSDRAGARTALAEATSRLATLPQTTRARRERAALLGDELRASFDRARMLTRLPQPLLVARTGDVIAFSSIGGVALLERDLAVLSNDGRRLALVNPKDGTGTVRELDGTHAVTAPFRTIALDDRSLLIIDAHARAAIIDARGGTAQIATIEQPPADIRDAAIYQARLYLLHDDGSITRHTRTAAGFARGSVWLESNRALALARTVSVSGPIMVNGDDGSLVTYAAGRRTDGELLADVDPPLRTASQMTVSADGRTLYLGDPGEGRVIAVNATGALVGQIQSDTFRGLSGIALDPSGTSLYVWHGDAISVVVPPKPAK